MTTKQLGFEDFEALVDQTFTMGLGPGSSTQLRLVSCTRRDLAGGPPSFALEFSGGPDAPVEQGTYLLSADETSARGLGSTGSDETAIFLVPLRQTPAGVDYLAVFNQLDQG